MHAIYALWIHPRAISTALERVMMARGDLKILHEPFSYFLGPFYDRMHAHRILPEAQG